VARTGEADVWKLEDATEDGRWVRGRRVEFFWGLMRNLGFWIFVCFIFLHFLGNKMEH
jgi:hypothetical protein